MNLKLQKINLKSGRGVSDAVETVFLMPVYYLIVVLTLGFGLWLWSMAANSLGLTRGAQGHGYGAGAAAERARQEVVRDALGGYGAPYGNATVRGAQRVVLTSVSATGGADNTIWTPFGSVPIPVRQGTLVRDERFQARPPASPGTALGSWE